MTVGDAAQLVRILRFYYPDSPLGQEDLEIYEVLFKPWPRDVGFIALERLVKQSSTVPPRRSLTAELGRVCLELCKDVGGRRFVLKENQPGNVDHGQTVFAQLPRAYG